MFCLIVPLLNFNPRSHEGSDILPVPPPAAVSISIHAPTRGATQTDRIRDRQSYNFNPRSHEGSDGAYYAAQCRFHNFNPRSHEGSDVMWLLLAQRQNVFQSTLPRGERHIKTYFCNEMYYFNPRSHEGSDYNWPLLP